MSRNSAKQLYSQTKTWLDSIKKSDPKAENKKESRSDYYKKKGFQRR